MIKKIFIGSIIIISIFCSGCVDKDYNDQPNDPRRDMVEP